MTHRQIEKIENLDHLHKIEVIGLGDLTDFPKNYLHCLMSELWSIDRHCAFEEMLFRKLKVWRR